MTQHFEYEVYELDPRYHLCHKGDCILATNNLAVACTYVYEHYKKYKIPCCVYQPKHESYREIYADWHGASTDAPAFVPLLKRYIFG